MQDKAGDRGSYRKETVTELPIAGTTAVHVHFIVAFPVSADVWVDDFTVAAGPGAS